MSLRVALALETSGGGSGRHVLDLACGLATKGHDVAVFWSRERAEPDFMAALDALPGVRAVSTPMRRAVGPHDLVSFRSLARALCAAGPFDVIHGHSSKAGALIRLLPRSIGGARIYTPHAFRTMDPDLRGPARFVFAKVEMALARSRAWTIAVSEAELDHARALGVPARRLRLVVNGTAPQTRTTRAEARAAIGGIEKGDVAVGFLGRLVAQKDPLRFVDAVRLAQARAPRLVGVLMGDGPLREAAEARATGARIIVTARVDGPAMMQGLDLFCMTSRYEAMPYTLLEAIHAGLPIVTTAVGGVAETVEPGRSGLVTPVDAPAEAIADALVALVSDPARLAAFGDAARALAAGRTIENMVRDTVAVYREAIDAEAPQEQAPRATKGETRV